MKIQEAKDRIQNWAAVNGDRYLTAELHVVLALGNVDILTGGQIELINALGHAKALTVSGFFTAVASAAENTIGAINALGEKMGIER